MRLLPFIALAILASLQGFAQSQNLRLVFVGDIMGHDTQIASALNTGKAGYDYTPCFKNLEPYLKEADLAIGNLEVTLAGPPFKGYPQFSSPDELADALKWAGFDILVTANNHALDRGLSGLERTLRLLDTKGLLHTGTFRDAGSRARNYPLLIEKNGIRIALLNYTYGTNGLKVKPPAIVNRIDRAAIRADLQKAALAEPDFTIVCMHWGKEYELTENAGQRDLARFLFDQGADAIIGSHPHVVQPVRGTGRGNLVVYSLGNHISNQRDRYRDGGIAFEMVVEKRSTGTEVSQFAYLPIWVWKPQMKKGTMFTLVPATAGQAAISKLGMPPDAVVKMRQFLEDTRQNLQGINEVKAHWMEP